MGKIGVECTIFFCEEAVIDIMQLDAAEMQIGCDVAEIVKAASMPTFG